MNFNIFYEVKGIPAGIQKTINKDLKSKPVNDDEKGYFVKSYVLGVCVNGHFSLLPGLRKHRFKNCYMCPTCNLKIVKRIVVEEYISIEQKTKRFNKYYVSYWNQKTETFEKKI